MGGRGQSPRPVLRWGVPLVLLLALILVAYRDTLQAGFVVWDDDDHVYENPHVLARDGYGEAWRDWRNTAFYPLTFTMFFLEWRAAGGEPWLFHFDNVVLHAANAVGLGLLGRALGLGAGVSWLAAALWGLHPLEVGSVAWITERKNVLYVFFYFAALLAYARSLSAPSRRSALLWFSSLLLLVASLLSKATAVTFPIAVGLLHWATGRVIDRRAVLRLSTYFAVALAVGLLHVFREEVEPGLDLGTRIFIAARATWFYIGSFAWPFDLVAMYPRWDPARAVSFGVPALAALVVVLGLALGFWRSGRLPRAAVFAAGLFACNIALVVGIIWFPYMRYSFVADHLAYLPSAGLALLAAIGAGALCDRLEVPAAVRATVAIGVCLGLAGLTKEQTGLWHDTERLWGGTLQVTPDSTVAHNNLGVFLLEGGRVDEARLHFDATLAIDPQDSTALFNLGVIAAGRREWDTAVSRYKEALRVNRGNALVWNNLGVVASERGDLEKAIAFYRHAIKLNPRDADSRVNLGAVLERSGDASGAMAEFETALTLNPRLLKAHYRLGGALAEAGRTEDAVRHLETAATLEPENTEVLRRLGEVLSEQGDRQGARRWFEQAVDVDPDDASLLYQLGVVLLGLGERDRAIEYLDRSAALAPRASAGEIHLGIATELDEHGAPEAAMAYYRKATVLAPESPDTFYGLGAALSAAGQHREAEAEYRRVLALAPDHPEGTNNLGVALLAQGRTAEAAEMFARALQLAPADVEVQRNLALALHESGRDADAVRILAAALAAAPADATLLNLMAWIRATSPAADVRDAAEAVRLAERASASVRNADPQYLDTLAAAYAGIGRYGDAVRTARQALVLATAGSTLAHDLERRLALYEQARPYRHE